MPIEIRELVIRARVEEQPSSSSPTATHSATTQRLSDSELQKIVTLCAEEVLKVLKRQKEK